MWMIWVADPYTRDSWGAMQRKQKSIVFMYSMLPCNNIQSRFMNYHAKIFFSLTFESGEFWGDVILKFAKLLCEQMYKLRYLLCWQSKVWFGFCRESLTYWHKNSHQNVPCPSRNLLTFLSPDIDAMFIIPQTETIVDLLLIYSKTAAIK